MTNAIANRQRPANAILTTKPLVNDRRPIVANDFLTSVPPNTFLTSMPLAHARRPLARRLLAPPNALSTNVPLAGARRLTVVNASLTRTPLDHAF
jgi:hypothetical protein